MWSVRVRNGRKTLQCEWSIGVDRMKIERLPSSDQYARYMFVVGTFVVGTYDSVVVCRWIGMLAFRRVSMYTVFMHTVSLDRT